VYHTFIRVKMHRLLVLVLVLVLLDYLLNTIKVALVRMFCIFSTMSDPFRQKGTLQYRNLFSVQFLECVRFLCSPSHRRCVLLDYLQNTTKVVLVRVPKYTVYHECKVVVPILKKGSSTFLCKNTGGFCMYV
jgi:hypothetical protein